MRPRILLLLPKASPKRDTEIGKTFAKQWKWIALAESESIRNVEISPCLHRRMPIMMPNAKLSLSAWSLVSVALISVAAFSVPATGQSWARNDGSVPMTLDWSNKHAVYTAGYSKEQFEKMMQDPRAFSTLLAHGDPNVTALVHGSANPSIRANIEANNYLVEHGGFGRLPGRPRPPSGLHPVSSSPTLERDWAVSLGTTAGVAQGMYPAKYEFNVNAAPSCPDDFAVYPVNASTGNTRAHVTANFSTTAQYASGTTFSLTVTPTVGSAITLSLTASTSSNIGPNFGVYTTGTIAANADSEATNLAAAINRNLGGAALGEIVAFVPSANLNTVTIYTLTPGAGITLSDATTVSNLTFTGLAQGASNNTQANIVGFNTLYAGTTPFCTGATYPAYIFSYASGVGPVATSPEISLDGTKVAYIENDSADGIGAILHILTKGSGSTEYGTCTVGGAGTAPTCAAHPVVPGGGNTGGSNATDYMLPLGLITNKTTGIDSYSSPFVDYQNDILYVGDNGGYLYKITPIFKGSTPAHAGGNFPVSVSANILSAPVLDLAGTGNIFVGDSGGFLYNYTSAGSLAATKLTVGTATGGGVRDAALVDSTNGVGYVDTPCTSVSAIEPLLTQFAFTASTLTSKSSKSLDYESGTLETGCNNPTPLPMYAPTLNNTYYSGGIGATGAAVTACTTNYNTETDDWYVNLETLEFTSGALDTTEGTYGYYGFAYTQATAAATCSPVTEFYGGDVTYTPSAVATAAGTPTTVTVTTPTNKFVTGQIVTLAGVTTGSGGCSSAVAAAIDAEQSVTVTSGTVFTFTIPITTAAAGTCALSTPTAVGPTVDYLFFGSSSPAEAYTFILPMPNSTAAAAPTATATADDAIGGTSGIIIDNDSTDGQASSIYYGTLGESAASTCGTGAYCAVKLTQSGLK
jgi:hypothetical protein